MTFVPQHFDYTAFYCEENAWQALAPLAQFYGETAVLWILGSHGCVALWNQRLAVSVNEPVLWDYHVIPLARETPDHPWLVFDLDSRLPLAISLRDYLALTFPLGESVPLTVQARFRWFSGSEYHRRFDSQRKHMREADGTWREKPPAWPLLRSNAGDAVHVEALRDADHPTSPVVQSLVQVLASLGSTSTNTRD